MISLSSHRMNRGFTLIELLVAMVLGLVVVGAVLKMFVSQNRTNAIQQEVAYAQQNVRAAMDLMAREIRSAGYDPADSGLTPIPAATTGSIQVRVDLNGDGDTADTGEDVTYCEVVDDTDTNKWCLARGGTRTVYDVVPNSLQFTYFKGDNSTYVPANQTDRDDIRVVAIHFQVHTENEDPGCAVGYDLYPANSGTCRVRTLFTRVRIRNVGFQDLE